MQKERLLLVLTFIALAAISIIATRLLRSSSMSYTKNTGLHTYESQPPEPLHSPTLQTACCIESAALTVQMIIQKSEKCSKNVNLQSVQCNCESLVVCKFVAVSAISDDHLDEAKDFIASVQTHMPKSPIIVYNLGLSKKNKKILSSYCDVQVRDFNFSKFPKHVRFLRGCAWKPLIINELYERLNGKVVMWADASCRVLHSITPLFPRLSTFPIISGIPDNHFFISTTHDGMMKYLKLNKTRKEYASIGNSLQAGITIFWLNAILQERFLKFWVDCALHEECIAPKGAKLGKCNWEKMKIGKYACHRYDQAAYNAILTRELGFDFMKEMARKSARDYFIVQRFPTQRYKLLSEGHCNDLTREYEKMLEYFNILN